MKKIIAIIVWDKNNANNSVIMVIIAIIDADKNKWNNSPCGDNEIMKNNSLDVCKKKSDIIVS